MLQRLALALLLAVPVAAFAQSPEGVWRTQPSDTGAYLHVRIAPCVGAADRVCGTILEAFDSTRTDLAGRAIIRDMAPDGAGRWRGGTIWAPDDDKTYRSRMSLQGDALKVEGCVAIICRGQIWSRVQ